MSAALVGILIAIVAGIVGIASFYFLGADNPVEEEMENIIKDETGIKIDLSPTTTTTTTTTTTPKS